MVRVNIVRDLIKTVVQCDLISWFSDFASYFYHFLIELHHAWIKVSADTMSELTQTS